MDFNNYSFYYFEEVARLQVHSLFEESALSKEEISLLADAFAKINSSYFLGEQIDLTELQEGIDLWKKQEKNFLKNYIESMLLHAQEDRQTLILPLD